MNPAGERIKCEYCESLNECDAIECRHCGAGLGDVTRVASGDEARRNQARELLKQAAQQFAEAGKNFGEARKHFEGARDSLKKGDD